jgi:hypothetical protein
MPCAGSKSKTHSAPTIIVRFSVNEESFTHYFPKNKIKAKIINISNLRIFCVSAIWRYKLEATIVLKYAPRILDNNFEGLYAMTNVVHGN